MRVRQKTYRVFEFDNVNDIERFKNYINKNHDILRNYILVVITKYADDIKMFLDQKNMKFVIKDFDFSDKKVFPPEEIEEKNEEAIENSIEKPIESNKNEDEEKNIEDSKNKKTVFSKIIRSGEEIVSDEDMVFLNKINAGSKIICNGNLEVFGDINGHIICNGEYMIIKNILDGAVVIFHNQIIENIDKLSLIRYDDNRVVIKEI